ncbi:FAD-dependent oxidoreductase [Candidatus Nomurabacteria bacterium]|uniref:FAD-dependent oxidoreductase n=1 Tax=Candidatus Dojkabacteria bacterium TaxID=2099670 RepID=A0A955I281_9BACT|nr:FAD-dependent oxidoreductase [Candidatus Dojkabacteria bacterium]MCB9790070.1 FAD-dependent oxidoreductase [Candidatus Nomurabacteria bacterium]
MFKTKLRKKYVVADSTLAVELDKPDNYIFQPGQYGSLLLEDVKEPTRDVRHTFSFASSPDKDTIRFVTRIRDSEYKKKLSDMNEESEVFLGLPGGFVIGEGYDGDKILFIVGGIGITPVLSYLESISSNDVAISLLWSNKSNSTTPFYDEFTNGRYADERIDVTFVTTETQEGDIGGKRIDQEIINSFLEGHSKEWIYVFGSENFVDDISSFLADSNISWESVKSESFPGY